MDFFCYCCLFLVTVESTSQIHELLLSYQLTFFPLHFFLLLDCKLVTSFYLTHLKLRFTNYAHVSLGDLHSLPLMFHISCWCSTKDQSSEHSLSLGMQPIVIHFHQNCSFVYLTLILDIWVSRAEEQKAGLVLLLFGSICCFSSASSRLFYTPELIMVVLLLLSHGCVTGAGLGCLVGRATTMMAQGRGQLLDGLGQTPKIGKPCV